jgi:hypothetical protein
MHLAIFQLTRSEDNSGAMKLEALRVQDFPDNRQQWLEVALAGALRFATLMFPNAQYLGAHIVESLEYVTNGSVDQRGTLGQLVC